jgi:hypothetical protein
MNYLIQRPALAGFLTASVCIGIQDGRDYHRTVKVLEDATLNAPVIQQALVKSNITSHTITKHINKSIAVHYAGAIVFSPLLAVNRIYNYMFGWFDVKEPQRMK